MFKKKDDGKQKDDGKKEKVKLLGSMKTSMSGAIAQAKTGTKNTQQTVKIQLTQQKLVDAKHKFGVEYMDLLVQGASEEQLQACVDTSLEEIQRLMGKLDKYQGIISDNKLKLEQKLAKQAGKPTPHTQPSINVTDSAEASSTAEDALAAASFPDIGATSSGGAPAIASATASNPFDDDHDVKAKHPVATAVPMAEAIPVSDTNNPFDDDDDDHDEKKPPAVKATSVNPFEDDGDDDHKPPAKSKSASVNPFEEEDDDNKVVAKPAAKPSVNPFEDDDDDDPPAAAPTSTRTTGSVNPFEDEDEEEEEAKPRSKNTSANPFDDDDDDNDGKAEC